MSERDTVLEALGALPPIPPPSALRARVRAEAARALAPAPLHPFWSIAAVATVVVYLGWAVLFTQPFQGRP